MTKFILIGIGTFSNINSHKSTETLFLMSTAVDIKNEQLSLLLVQNEKH